MKTVLIVDDEKSLLKSLQDGFRDADEFTIVTAENGAKANVILASTPVDLVITDLKMPVMDGFELLAFMSKHHPQVPAIVMTAHGNAPDVESQLKRFTVSQYLTKPIDIDELRSVILHELKLASSGQVHNLTLPAFLQLIVAEQRTCTLTVAFGGETGTWYFRNGELLDAATGGMTGDEAVRHMARWQQAAIDIAPRCQKKEKAVQSPLSVLLEEGLRRSSELPPKQQAPATASPVSQSSAIQAAPGPAVRPVPEQTAGGSGNRSAGGTLTKEGKMATTREILGELAKLPSVTAVCLVARDGFLLDSIARSGIDKEMIGAIASSGFGSSESMGRQLDKGLMQISMIEFEQGPVMLSPIGEDAFLVIVADKDANLGMIRLKLKKHSGELALAAAI